MRAFWAIFKREFVGYFTSPIGYVVLTIFAALAGYFYLTYLEQFHLMCLQYEQIRAMQQQRGMMPPLDEGPNYMEMLVPAIFATFSVIMIFVIPLLTMRAISEEKKQGTIELLYTYPVSDFQVVVGKYAASLGVFSLLLLLILVYMWLPGHFQDNADFVNWGHTSTAMLGFFLLGAASIAIGFVFSALTENQVVSASFTFAVLLFLWVAGAMGESEGVDWWKKFAESISLTNRSQDLFRGVVHLSDLAYFACVTVGSLFITMRALESHRWRS